MSLTEQAYHRLCPSRILKALLYDDLRQLEDEEALLRIPEHDRTPAFEAADARALAQGHCQHVCTGAHILPCRDILKAPHYRLGIVADEVSKRPPACAHVAADVIRTLDMKSLTFRIDKQDMKAASIRT